MEAWVVISLFFIALFALCLLWLEGLIKHKAAFAVSVLFIALAFFLRGLVISHVTLDYTTFLSQWVDYFRENGGFKALSGSVGNYNLPYLYFIALFSYADGDFYLIKLLSVFFDVVLAWGAMRIISMYTGSANKKLFVFLMVLLLPTVILNGACWGQCDSIYVAFAVLGLYLVLDDKPVLSVICITLSFAFKLQAVFIMPVYLVLLLSGRIKPLHLLIFPAAYLVIVSPALLLGRPLLETVTLYLDQAGSVGGGLNYNSPSVFAFVNGDVDGALLSNLGVLAAFVFMTAVCVLALRRGGRIKDVTVLTCALLFSIGIPFLLPHMHDRYFFAADVLSLVFAVVVPRYFFVPVLVSFSSLLGYHAYLKMFYLLPMKYGAAALIIVLIFLLMYLTQTAYSRRKAKK